MITSLQDLIASCGALPPNSIPFYDGCDWKFVQLPENGLNTCDDVLTCITSQFIASLLSSSDNSILVGANGSLTINPVVLQGLINVQLVGTNLTVGGTTVDLSSILANGAFTINDGTNSTVINLGDVLNIVAIDGLRFFVSANDQVSIGLPTNRQGGQVLTWNEDTGEAEWQNNQCCAQTLNFDTDTNTISISGGNSVDLSSINTDNQTLSIIGNLLSISQLNGSPQTIDLSQVNEHTLSINGSWDGGGVFINILGSDGNINNTIQVPRPDVANCADVMACAGIQAIISDIVILTNRVIALENNMQLLQSQLP